MNHAPVLPFKWGGEMGHKNGDFANQGCLKSTLSHPPLTKPAAVVDVYVCENSNSDRLVSDAGMCHDCSWARH